MQQKEELSWCEEIYLICMEIEQMAWCMCLSYFTVYGHLDIFVLQLSKILSGEAGTLL